MTYINYNKQFEELEKEKKRKKKENPIVLKGVSLEIKEGDYCAFVGMSGTGKSTAIKLIHRYYNPT